MKFPLYLAILFLLVAGCSSDAMDDYNDLSLNLINQNEEPVQFPGDFSGSPILMGFVYTHCPDICSFITANLLKVYEEMGEPEGIQFVIVTFDPSRDTPAVLKNYAGSFNMDRPPFTFLTGAEEDIETLMNRVGIRSQVSFTREMEEGDDLYFLSHSDTILLIDGNGRLIMDYGGSMTPTSIFIEDLKKL